MIDPPSAPGVPAGHPQFSRHPLLAADFILAVVLFVSALLVRWPLISRGETLLHCDEGVVGIMAQDIAAGRHYPIYFYGQKYMGAMEAYVIAALLPFFDNPIHALRAGPALFFAALVAVQYLMLTRWFGRSGGLVGAFALLAAAPMFAQWSISARGGYIEILLVGTLLLWSYFDWFVAPTSASDSPSGAFGHERLKVSTSRRFLFGVLIGFGLWINPAIAVFILAISIHCLVGRPLMQAYESPRFGPLLGRASDGLGRATSPMVIFSSLLIANCIWATWIEDGEVRSSLVLSLLPKYLSAPLVGLGVLAIMILVIRRIGAAAGPIILGIWAGAAPAMLYVIQVVVGMRPLDPSLPLGLRPIWLVGETLVYLIGGLPLLFGADPRPFLQHVTVGRDVPFVPLDIMTSSLVVAGNYLVFGAAITAAVVLIASHRSDLGRLLRLQPILLSPTILLVLGVASTVGLFVIGGCTFSFTTIRYLLPLWAFLPGLLAAVFVSPVHKLAARLVPLVACAAWAVGQFALYASIGRPHPLHSLADAVVAAKVDPAVAEILDAHLLSYLTQQRCRTVEFEPFWPRLAHFRPLVYGLDRAGSPPADHPTDYIVNTHEIDRSADWTNADSPGPAPPETVRILWPRLFRAVAREPSLLLSRRPLVGGYELIRLRRPLPDRLPS